MVFSEKEENILVTLSMEIVLFLSKAMEIYKIFYSECVDVKLLQLCPTLCNPLDCSPPGSSVRRILQARTLVGWHALLQGLFPTQGLNPGLLLCRKIVYHLRHQGSPKICITHMCACMLSHFSYVQLFATSWAIAHQAPNIRYAQFSCN